MTVQLSDIQPGAEFYEVFCVRGDNPTVRQSTFVVNSFPTYWSPCGDGKYEDDGAHTFVNCSSVRSGRVVTTCRSLIDLHIIRTDRTEAMSYNLHRWFKTKEEADAFVESINTGELEHLADQAFYNDSIEYARIINA